MSPAKSGSGSSAASEPTVLFVAAVILFFIFLVWLHVLIFKEVRRARVRPAPRTRQL